MSSNSAWGFTVLGDLDREDFSFNTKLTYDELIVLLERNPRMSQMCDWLPAEALKNWIKWKQDEQITYTTKDVDGNEISESISKDEYLELIKFKAEAHRAIMFARLQGTSLMKIFREEGKLATVKTYHRSQATSGWKIMKDDLGEDGKPKSFSLYLYPPLDEPAVDPKPRQSKLLIKDVVVFPNPMKGERWGGTPSSKLIDSVAQLEELIMKLLGKHALDIVDNFFMVNNIESEEQAEAIHDQIAKLPLRELYVNGIEIIPMSLNIQGKVGDFEGLIKILKDFMANAMRISAQAMDGAAQGTISSAEFNTMISYAVVEQIQNHFKPYLEECFRRLGFKYPDFEWNKPIQKLDEQNKPRDGNNE